MEPSQQDTLAALGRELASRRILENKYYTLLGEHAKLQNIATNRKSRIKDLQREIQRLLREQPKAVRPNTLEVKPIIIQPEDT